MKRIFLVCLVVAVAITGTVQAQAKKDPPKKPEGVKDWLELPSSGMTAQGPQTIPIPGGKGMLKFVKNGDTFSNVVIINATGKSFNLLPSKPGTNGAPQPSCKYPLPDACFATADKSIVMCVCKPTDLAGNNGPYTFNVGDIKGLLSSISTSSNH